MYHHVSDTTYLTSAWQLTSIHVIDLLDFYIRDVRFATVPSALVRVSLCRNVWKSFCVTVVEYIFLVISWRH
jgi:hypothetical protein